MKIQDPVLKNYYKFQDADSRARNQMWVFTAEGHTHISHCRGVSGGSRLCILRGPCHGHAAASWDPGAGAGKARVCLNDIMSCDLASCGGGQRTEPVVDAAVLPVTIPYGWQAGDKVWMTGSSVGAPPPRVLGRGWHGEDAFPKTPFPIARSARCVGYGCGWASVCLSVVPGGMVPVETSPRRRRAEQPDLGAASALRFRVSIDPAAATPQRQ